MRHAEVLELLGDPAPNGYGCEPRFHYGACNERLRFALPIFYALFLALQSVACACIAISLFRSAARALGHTRAPHEAAPFGVRVRVVFRRLSKQTVLQLKLLVLFYTLAAVIHHLALLTPTPLLPILVIEYAYNAFNVFLVGHLFILVSFCREFVERTATVLDPDRTSEPGIAQRQSGRVGARRADRLLSRIFSFKGASCVMGFAAAFCLVTDTWGLHPDGRNWRIACRMQHNLWGIICSTVALGLLRLGGVLRTQLDKVVLKHAGVFVQGKAALVRYSRAFLCVYIVLSCTWLLCGVSCALPGVLFKHFYLLQPFLALHSLFNATGLIVAMVTFVLDNPGRAHLELQLHDLLAYLAERASERASERDSQGEEGRSTDDGETDPKNDVTFLGGARSPLTEWRIGTCESSSAWPTPSDRHRHLAVSPRDSARRSSAGGAGTGSATVVPINAVVENTHIPQPFAQAAMRLGLSGTGGSGYPCYVMALRVLIKYDRIPSHEEALRDGTLEILRADSYWPCRSNCYFISHTWLSNRDGSRTHPDGDADGPQPKLSWLRRMPRSTFLDNEWSQAFIWMDYLSIPQNSPTHQRLAINSLAEYAALCGRFIPLVAEPSDSEGYLRRGWCSTECIAALTPKIDGKGHWRIGPSRNSLRFRFYDATRTEESLRSGRPRRQEHAQRPKDGDKDKDQRVGEREAEAEAEEAERKLDEQVRGAAAAPTLCANPHSLHSVRTADNKLVASPQQFRICLARVRSPLDARETSYTDESDRAQLRGLITNLAGVMAAYEASGSTAWEHTDDIRNRPSWLRDLAAGSPDDV